MNVKRKTTDPSTTTKLPIKVKGKPIGSGTYGVVWDVLYPRNGKRVALKKIKKVFVSPESAIMVFRELRMLCTFKHDNVLAALEVVKPSPLRRFKEVYILTDLLHNDLDDIIYSKQLLTANHIHVFMYQIMRGLKYIHSAKVIHRDIKPGNILVYDNCMLKICDFGLARAEVTDKSKEMCLDVVTQGYRAPEILLETKHYTGAIDVWAAACVFVELFGRDVVFSSSNHFSQLDLMLSLLGTPLMSDIDYASESMKNFVSRLPRKTSKISSLHDLSPLVTDEAVDLISRMLKFNPNKRLSAAEVLDHPYMVRGRKLYHSLLCKCCSTTKEDVMMPPMDLEPVASEDFDDRWEREITSVAVAKVKMHQYITERLIPGREHLCINHESKLFKKNPLTFLSRKISRFCENVLQAPF